MKNRTEKLALTNGRLYGCPCGHKKAGKRFVAKARRRYGKALIAREE